MNLDPSFPLELTNYNSLYSQVIKICEIALADEISFKTEAK